VSEPRLCDYCKIGVHKVGASDGPCGKYLARPTNDGEALTPRCECPHSVVTTPQPQPEQEQPLRIGPPEDEFERQLESSGQEHAERGVTLTDEEYEMVSQTLGQAFIDEYERRKTAKNWAGWVIERNGERFECQVQRVGGVTTTEKILELQTTIAQLEAENARLLTEYGSQDVQAECRERLNATGFGRPGHSNTLLGMVVAACEEVLRLREVLSVACSAYGIHNAAECPAYEFHDIACEDGRAGTNPPTFREQRDVAVAKLAEIGSQVDRAFAVRGGGCDLDALSNIRAILARK